MVIIWLYLMIFCLCGIICVDTEYYFRVAVLLLRQNAFTRFCVHLRGKYQLKKRHLEIFGYEVAVVNFSEWIGLLHAEERLKFISKAMSSSKRNTNDVFR